MMFLRNLALVGLGAAMVIVYQKYNEPMMRCVDKVIDNMTGKAKEDYYDMM